MTTESKSSLAFRRVSSSMICDEGVVSSTGRMLLAASWSCELEQAEDGLLAQRDEMHEKHVDKTIPFLVIC
jgi:hypothetical protein